MSVRKHTTLIILYPALNDGREEPSEVDCFQMDSVGLVFLFSPAFVVEIALEKGRYKFRKPERTGFKRKKQTEMSISAKEI